MSGKITLTRTYDLAPLQELDRKVMGPAGPLSDYHMWWAGRTSNGQLVAYCGLRIYWLEDEKRGFLSRAGVAESHRGQGLQRRMIQLRERKARAEQVSRLVTYTAADNLASANNLIRCGYLLYTPSCEWGVKGALYFYKLL